MTIEKDLGRQLRGKKMAAVSCSIGENLGDHFWLPFIYTANYLGMDFISAIHLLSGNDNDKLDEFIEEIENEI